MYGGERDRWVAYVGIAGNLRLRLTQHFVRRDSSVVTSTSAVGVNIDHVTQVDWWESALFKDDDARHAAELVAYGVLEPALRSRAKPRSAAMRLYEDAEFRAAVRRVLRRPPSGRLLPPRLSDLAQRLTDLERRVRLLEQFEIFHGGRGEAR
jgi:hypothetical protein